MKETSSHLLQAAALALAAVLGPNDAVAQNVATVATSGNIYQVNIDAQRNWAVTRSLASPQYCYGISHDPHGKLYFCDTPDGTIFVILPGGTPTAVASNQNYPSGLTVGADGEIILAGFGSGCDFVIQPGGSQSPIACGLAGPVSVRPYWRLLTSDDWFAYWFPENYPYYDDHGYPTRYHRYLNAKRGDSPGGVDLLRRNPDGTWTNQQAIATGLNLAYDAVPNQAGDVFVSELGNNRILVFPVTGNGTISTNPVVFATNLAPIGLAFDYAGNLYEADFGGAINKFVLTNGTLNPTPIAVLTNLDSPTYLAFPPPPIVGIQRAGGNVVLAWPDALYTLQTAAALTGGFETVPGATSPYTNPISGGASFFRLESK